MKKTITIIALISFLSGFSQDYFIERGIQKSKIGDYNEAILDFTRAILTNPYNKEAYFYRGISKYELKDFKGAIIDLTKTIELGTNLPFAYFFRAESKCRLQDNRGALLDYSKTIELDPNDSSAYFRSGALKLSVFQLYNEAILDFNKSIQLDPKHSRNTNTYYFRGLAKIALNQKDSACLDFSKAGELGNSEAYEAIKEYCQQGN